MFKGHEEEIFVNSWDLIKPYLCITYFSCHGNQLSEWNWKGEFIHIWGVTGVSLLSRHCEWCIFPSLWTCSLFNCYLSVALGPYVQYFSGHEIAFLNSPVQKGECAPSIHSWKAPCKWCTSHLEELIVLFYLLISIAHLHACVQNDKETRNCNSHMHRVITWAVAQASFLHSIL
jgi:hypothetical protein